MAKRRGGHELQSLGRMLESLEQKAFRSIAPYLRRDRIGGRTGFVDASTAVRHLEKVGGTIVEGSVGNLTEDAEVGTKVAVYYSTQSGDGGGELVRNLLVFVYTGARGWSRHQLTFRRMGEGDGHHWR